MALLNRVLLGHRLLLLAIVTTFLLPSLSVARDDESEPLQILLITGGCCHDYSTQKQLIKNGLESRANCEVTVVQQGGTTTDTKIEVYEEEGWADGFDVVIHDECFADVKDQDWVEQILSPHRNGVPAVVIHCAMHCYRTGNDDWFEFCGVTSRRHGAHYAHEVLNYEPTHPIMSSFPAGWMNPAGELYWIEKIWPRTTVLACAKNRELGNAEPCVWTNDYRGTRVFGTTLGHHNVTVEAPEFLDMLTRGTLWAAGALDEASLNSPEPKVVPINVAQSRDVNASSEETPKGNLASLAVDGDKSTRWCAANNLAPQWLQIDLGEVKKLNGLQLFWENSGSGYRYQVESSLDADQWTMLVDHSSDSTKDHFAEFDLRESRYVKVTFLGCDTGHWGSIWEVELYGEETRVIDPKSIVAETERKYLDQVTAPEEFEVSLFAAPPAVQYPVFVCAADDGSVYVAVDRNGSLGREANRGAIYRLRDVDDDGNADEVKLFVANVDSPRGMVWDRDRLYVMHPPHLSAFIDHDGDGVSDEQEVLVKNIAFTFADRPADHSSNGVTLGIDGWLYLAIGDFGFMDAEGADGTRLGFRGGGVVRVRPDGSGLELYSRGTRNILEVAMDPLLNGYARDNTNDGGGWDIRLHHFSGLEDHGYPRRFLNFTDEVIAPVADYGGGSGCGALYLDESPVPERWNSALMTADWGRNAIFHHRLTPSGSSFKDEQTTFMQLPRATDLDVDRRGDLFAASWQGATFNYNGEDVGFIVRLTPKSSEKTILLDLKEATPYELILELRADSHRRRLSAQRELLSREWNREVLGYLVELMHDREESLESRVASLFAVKQYSQAASIGTLLNAAEVEELRPFVIRALGDRLGQGTPWRTTESSRTEVDPNVRDLVVSGLASEDERTRLESMISLSRLELHEDAKACFAMLADPDQRIRHTVINGLIRLDSAEFCFDVLDRANATSAHREAAFRVLQAKHNAGVVDEIINRFSAATETNEQNELFAAACRLYFVEGEWKGNSWGTRPDTRGPYYQPEEWEMTPQLRELVVAGITDCEPSQIASRISLIASHRIEIDEVTQYLTAVSKQHPELREVVVAELSRVRNVPESAFELLQTMAINGDASVQKRISAIDAMMRTRHKDALMASMDAAARITADGGGDRDVQQLRRLLLRGGALIPHLGRLQERYEESESNQRAWFLAALMSMLKSERLTEDERQVVLASIERSLARDDQRAMVFNAAFIADYRDLSREVQVDLESDDAELKRIGQKIAKAWGLESSTPSSGPMLVDIENAEIMARIHANEGDVGLGARVFARLACANCHTVSGDEALRGPHLPQVAKTYQPNQIAEAILEPSKTIAQGFATQLFVMVDGRTIVGFVTREGDEIVILRDKDGEEYELATDDIEDRVEQKVSVMPNELSKDLTLEEFEALVSYVDSLGKQAEGDSNE